MTAAIQVGELGDTGQSAGHTFIHVIWQGNTIKGCVNAYIRLHMYLLSSEAQSTRLFACIVQSYAISVNCVEIV